MQIVAGLKLFVQLLLALPSLWNLVKEVQGAVNKQNAEKRASDERKRQEEADKIASDVVKAQEEENVDAQDDALRRAVDDYNS